MELWKLLLDVIVLLTACLIVGGIFSRFGQSPLVGYLLSGMLLGGPGSIRAVKSEHEIETIAELGVSLLLFSIGLEFSFKRLKDLGSKPLLGGVLQVTLTAMATAGIVFFLGLASKESIAVGAMIALSSTACVLRILIEKGEMEAVHGRNSLAVLLVQDMSVVPLAILMTLLASGGGVAGILSDLGQIVLWAAALIFALYVLVNKLAVWALGTLTLERNRELTVLLAVVTGLGSTWAAHAVGISPALGAFIAGLFIGSSAFATQIRADISSLRVILLTLFFGGAGMVADPVWILKNFHIVFGAVFLLVVGKTAVIGFVFRLLGQPVSTCLATGICLAQIGEFAFVLGAIGLEGKVISEATYQLIVSTAIVSLFITPFLIPHSLKLGVRIASWIPGASGEVDRQSGSEGFHPDAVMVGFGPAGQIAARALMDHAVKVLVLDLNHDGVKKAREFGFEGQVGDATHPEVLEHAHIETARIVVITIPHQKSALEILGHVRDLAPQAHVVVRSRYQRYTNDIVMAGTHAVFGDEEEIGGRIARYIESWKNLGGNLAETGTEE
ncbi:MAG: cation:proton antiporter [Candidatus Omnitrophica bacterium]|nr:cation:proton antiporter [Candidatus Omnitrophota bacterium]MCA9439192.1 cation:proton antiporter [Candidatus Omnitrophota bacterium]